jgi:Class III cytochrome C family
MKRVILIIFVLSGSLVTAQKIQPAHINVDGLSCRTCHSCDIPTKENPCVRTCPRDKMVSISRSPAESPNVIYIDRFDKGSKVYGPVTFTHRLHAEMSGLAGGCKMCHHYNPPGEVAGCSDCHEISRKRADVSKPDLKGAYHRQCMECHRQWSGEVECISCHNQKDKTGNASVPPKTAAKVHPKIVEPVSVKFETPKGPGRTVNFSHTDHAKLFGIDCSKCHSNEGCIKCHATDKVKALSAAAVEHHLNCAKCHDTKSDCSLCHGNAPGQRFDHYARTGFDLSKHHGRLACARCHTDKEKFTGLSGNCVNCHGAWTKENFQHKITGLALDETHAALECADCHQENNYEKPACTNCHDDKSFPKNVPGKLLRGNSNGMRLKEK